MKRIPFIFVIILLISSCGLLPQKATPTPDWTATPVPTETPLPEPKILVTSVPDARITAAEFLENWKSEKYIDMFNMLSQVSRDAINFESFSARYAKTAITMTLDKIDYAITSVLTNPGTSQIGFTVEFITKLAGEFSRNYTMVMTLEEGQWKIQWDEGLILPEFQGGNQLIMDITVPPRGLIYDINGVALASEADVVAIGVVPSQFDENRWENITNELSKATGKTTHIISQMLKEGEPTEYHIIGEAPAEVVDKQTYLMTYSGVFLNYYNSGRYYHDGGVAPHAVGYVQPIGAEESDKLQRAGYRIDERIGKAGIEKWAQDQLDGERGISLYVADKNGNAISRITRTEPLAANSLYTTFDSDFQYDLQRSIAGFKGAVVVLEMNTGRVIGMASSPTFDPNLLDFTNYNNYFSREALFGVDRPMYNRATQGQYPLGSVFKIIGMAAALESGVFKATDTIDCGYEFKELDGVTLTDWTLDHDIPPSGVLTLQEGLMRSCNPWFYKIGLELYRQKGKDYLPNMARSFGLGSLTEIGEMEEAPGNVSTPTDEYSSVQLGIGQSTLLVTPLQVARFVAAIGNGGTLYRPQVVEQILNPKGEVIYAFEPEAQGTLPISDENIKLIQEAMDMVTHNDRGTAFNIFGKFRHYVYGKTGTAQTSPGFKPHAWFAGYTNEKIEGKPDIAIAVLAEYAGEGFEIATPILRRAVELYFDGKASTLYKWESGVYITQTPTPTPTVTPVPTLAPYATATFPAP